MYCKPFVTVTSSNSFICKKKRKFIQAQCEAMRGVHLLFYCHEPREL